MGEDVGKGQTVFHCLWNGDSASCEILLEIKDE